VEKQGRSAIISAQMTGHESTTTLLKFVQRPALSQSAAWRYPTNRTHPREK
jgi:hypothetical protein